MLISYLRVIFFLGQKSTEEYAFWLVVALTLQCECAIIIRKFVVYGICAFRLFIKRLILILKHHHETA